MRTFAPFALLALAACTPAADDGADAPIEQATSPALAEINAQPVVATTGSVKLTPLAATAASAIGAQGQGCTFAYQSRSLLVASDARAPKAVAIIDGAEVNLTNAGGAAGPVLSGGGYTVSVLAQDGGTADLAIAGPQGETLFAGGTWSCGR